MKSITQVVESLIKPYIDSHDRAAEAIIAPVETDATSASDDYAVGKQLILNNVLYDVIAPITTGDALVVNTNIKASDNVSSDIEALTKELEDEAATRSAQGAKNIMPFDLDDIKALNTNGTWAGNVYTYRGVDFTVNSDGTVSATGTATGGNASIKLFAASSNYEMLGKEVILNGCPSNGSASTYRIQAYRMASADGSTGTYFDDGAGTDAFTVLNNASGTVGSFAIVVYENATVTNLLFKPMVRLASDPDATYQQYAKTNRELTAENQTLTNDTYNVNDTAITEVESDDLLPIYDTSATGKKKIAVSNFIGGLVSNPNLLDNPWFTVNQRGFSSTSAQEYTVDRWKKTATVGNVSLDSDGCINIYNDSTGSTWMNFQQVLDEQLKTALQGKTCTLSVMLKDGTIKSATGVLDFTQNSTYCLVVLTRVGTSNIGFGIRSVPANSLGSIQIAVPANTAQGVVPAIKAIKLELGSVSTLAQDTAPNYATELLKCQRYFERVGGSAFAIFGVGFYASTNNLETHMKIAPKRIAPSITLNGTVYCWDDDAQGANAHQSTALQSGANCSLNGDAFVSFVTSGATKGKSGFAQFRDTTSYIDFSADL